MICLEKLGFPQHIWSEWNHFQSKTMPACSFPPQVETHLQGHHISAACAAGAEASAGLKGSGSTKSCIKDKSGEEIYLSSAQSISHPGRGPLETAWLLGIWWAEAPSRHCLRSDWSTAGTSLASWSWTSAWTGYGTEPAGGPASTAGSSNVSGI